MRKILLVLLLGLFVFNACTVMHVNKFTENVYEPTKPEDIVIMTKRPSRSVKYTELAEIDFHLNMYGTSYKALKKKAAKLGADALIIVNPTRFSDNKRRAVAIKYQ
jgi:predicted SpoU family rRNA methylase